MMYIKIYVFKTVEFESDIEIQSRGHEEAEAGSKFENLSKIR